MRYEHNRDKAEYFKIGENTSAPHFHRSIELFYCISGEKCVGIDGRQHILGKGEFLLIPPFTVHSTPECDQTSLCVVMPMEYSSIFEEIVGTKKLKSMFFRDAKMSRELYMQLLKLEHEKSPLVRDGIYRLVLGTLLENAELDESSEKNTYSFAFNVLNFLENNYSERLTLETASCALGYNRCYFSTLFKKTFHMGFCDYLSMMRVEKSLSLLGKHSIKETAFKVGFGSLQSYYSAFRRLKGISPAAYQKTKTKIQRKRHETFRNQHPRSFHSYIRKQILYVRLSRRIAVSRQYVGRPIRL